MKRIAFLDLEGTLVESSAWYNVKDLFGAKELSKKYGKLYDEGKVGFEEWRRELVKIWKENKATKKQFIDAVKDYKLVIGTEELILGLKEKGFKIIIITGAVSPFAELIKEDLDIDEIYTAHEFKFDKGGTFKDIVTHSEYRRGQGKLHFIEKVIKKEKAKKEDCIAIGGDDINDYWMLKELKSFAVNPKINKIKDVVDYEVDNLIDILDCI